MAILCFLANVRQRNIACGVVHIIILLLNLLLLLLLLFFLIIINDNLINQFLKMHYNMSKECVKSSVLLQNIIIIITIF